MAGARRSAMGSPIAGSFTDTTGLSRQVAWRACVIDAVKPETVGRGVEAGDANDFGHATAGIRTRDVDNHVDREGDRLADAVVWQAHVRGQDAVCQPRQRLLRRVCVNGAETPEVPRVQRLQQIEGLTAAHFANDDAVGSMSEGRANEIGDRDGRQRLLLPEGPLTPSGLE